MNIDKELNKRAAIHSFGETTVKEEFGEDMLGARLSHFLLDEGVNLKVVHRAQSVANDRLIIKVSPTCDAIYGIYLPSQKALVEELEEMCK